MKTGNNSGALCAKVRAMYGKRLKPEDYLQMMSQPTVGMIASFLAEHPGYSEGLGEGINADIHREQLEYLLRNQRVYDYSKLICHTAYSDKKLMHFFVLLSDIEIILSHIRRLNAGALEEYHVSVPAPIDERSEVQYSQLNKAGDLEGLLAALEGTMYKEPLQRARNSDGSGIDYTDAEVGLYNIYYLRLFNDLRKGLGKRAHELEEMVGMRVDLRNIACTLRMRKYYNVKPEEIYSLMISRFYKIPSGLPAQMMAASDDSEVERLLSETPYGELLKGCAVADIDGRIDEILLEKYRKVMRTSKNGAMCAIAYIFYRGIEVRNVIHIIECVRYSVKAEDIPRYVVGMRQEGGGKAWL